MQTQMESFVKISQLYALVLVIICWSLSSLCGKTWKNSRDMNNLQTTKSQNQSQAPLEARPPSHHRFSFSWGATLGGIFGFNQALRHQAPVELLQVRVHTLPIRLAHLHHVVHIQQLGAVH